MLVFSLIPQAYGREHSGRQASQILDTLASSVSGDALILVRKDLLIRTRSEPGRD